MWFLLVGFGVIGFEVVDVWVWDGEYEYAPARLVGLSVCLSVIDF